MKALTFALVATALAIPTVANAAVELVTNGNFELTNVGAGQKKYFTQAAVQGWTGGANLTFIGAPGTADNPALYLDVYGPFPATSPVGGNFVLADADPNYRGAFWQTISGLTVGKKYDLSFWQAAGQQRGFTGPTTERWIVSFGNDTVYSNTFHLPQGGVGPWEKQTFSFTASATSQVLKFLADGTPGGAPPISFLDGVSLQAAVPEPATWAMLIVGFGAVGFASRRRRQTVAA